MGGSHQAPYVCDGLKLHNSGPGISHFPLVCRCWGELWTVPCEHVKAALLPESRLREPSPAAAAGVP